MQVEGFLKKDEAVRLECLRLAIAAGTPLRAPDFAKFICDGEPMPQPRSGFIAQDAVDVT